MVRTLLLLWCGTQPQFIARGAEPGLWDLGTWIWHLFLETNLAYMLFFCGGENRITQWKPLWTWGESAQTLHTQEKRP